MCKNFSPEILTTETNEYSISRRTITYPESKNQSDVREESRENDWSWNWDLTQLDLRLSPKTRAFLDFPLRIAHHLDLPLGSRCSPTVSLLALPNAIYTYYGHLLRMVLVREPTFWLPTITSFVANSQGTRAE